MNYRVTRIYTDDGAFGYVAPPCEEVIADNLTLAEAKAIYRHHVNKHWYDEYVTVELEMLTEDEEWSSISQGWAYEEAAKKEEWFERKGFDYMWWLCFDEIKRLA